MRFVRAALMVMAMTLLPDKVFSQPLFFDNFGYSTGDLTTVSNPVWTFAFGASDFVVNSTNLTKAGYASDNSINSVTIDATKTSAVKASFTAQTTGAVYVSFLLKVSNAPTTADGANYVIGLWQSSSSANAFGTVYAIDSSGTLKLAVSRFDAAANKPKATENLAFNTDHLVVVKYVFKGGINDDSVYMYINPTLPGSEPSPSVRSQDVGLGNPANLGRILINQDSNNGANAQIDAIRIATSWNEAPLPVQMLAFNATASRLDVNLNWTTAAETNNYGFEIERRSIGATEQGGWERVGFVQGAGTTTDSRQYSYSDSDVWPGRYAYRIKQIDFSGAFTYYSAAEVEVGLAPKDLALEPNYPNPFNPTTNISFSVPEDGRTVLRVYNMLGQEVAVLFEGEAIAGKLYRATFDASSLPTGVYVSRLEFGGQSVMRKMLFVK